MPLFDQSVTIDAPRSVVAELIRRRALPGEQVISLREAPVLIVLGESVGYVYVLSSEAGGTHVRLVAAGAQIVRDAFRGNDLHDALLMIGRTASVSAASVSQLAALALRALQESSTLHSAKTVPVRSLQQRLTTLFRPPSADG